MYKQIKFWEEDAQQMIGGILTPEGSIICACCGALIDPDEFDDMGIEIVTTYPNWVNFSEAIIEE